MVAARRASTCASLRSDVTSSLGARTTADSGSVCSRPSREEGVAFASPSSDRTGGRRDRVADRRDSWNDGAVVVGDRTSRAGIPVVGGGRWLSRLVPVWRPYAQDPMPSALGWIARLARSVRPDARLRTWSTTRYLSHREVSGRAFGELSVAPFKVALSKFDPTTVIEIDPLTAVEPDVVGV